jgi:hypothetical protein
MEENTKFHYILLNESLFCVSVDRDRFEACQSAETIRLFANRQRKHNQPYFAVGVLRFGILPVDFEYNLRFFFSA